MMTNEGDFDILDAATTGTEPSDDKLSFRSKANVSYDVSSPVGRLEFAKHALGSRRPNPTIVYEKKIDLWTGLASVDKYLTEIKCQPSV